MIIECAGCHFFLVPQVNLALTLIVQNFPYPEGCINTDRGAESAKTIVRSNQPWRTRKEYRCESLGVDNKLCENDLRISCVPHVSTPESYQQNVPPFFALCKLFVVFLGHEGFYEKGCNFHM